VGEGVPWEGVPTWRLRINKSTGDAQAANERLGRRKIEGVMTRNSSRPNRGKVFSWVASSIQKAGEGEGRPEKESGVFAPRRGETDGVQMRTKGAMRIVGESTTRGRGFLLFLSASEKCE